MTAAPDVLAPRRERELSGQTVVMIGGSSGIGLETLELAPVRVNCIAAGFVDTPLSASFLGGDLEKRREQLRAMLPIRRVVGPADVAALAVHLMTNTRATYDIDGGEQLVSG